MGTIKGWVDKINPIATLIAALIGFIAGYLVWREDVKEMKQDIKSIYALEMENAVWRGKVIQWMEDE